MPMPAARHPLPLHHVHNAIHRAERPRPSTSRAAVHHHWPLTPWLRLGRIPATRFVRRAPDHAIAMLNQTKHMRWVGRRPEIGPAGILQLCDLAHRLEGLGGVGKREFADNHMRLFRWTQWVGSILDQVFLGNALWIR